FFQAEDGIRDLTVTGVQTCALPVSIRGAVTDVIVACGNWSERRQREQTAATILAALIQASDGDYENEVITRTAVTLADALRAERSEERRVGKEGRSGWWP